MSTLSQEERGCEVSNSRAMPRFLLGCRCFDLAYGFEQGLNRRPLSEVFIEMEEAYAAFAIRDHDSWVRHGALALVEDAVGLDGLGFSIDEQRNLDLLGIPIGFQILGLIRANRPDFSVQGFEGIELCLQLAELRSAEWSPSTTEKNHQDVLLSTQGGKGEVGSCRIRQGEVRGLLADLDPRHLFCVVGLAGHGVGRRGDSESAEG